MELLFYILGILSFTLLIIEVFFPVFKKLIEDYISNKENIYLNSGNIIKKLIRLYVDLAIKIFYIPVNSIHLEYVLSYINNREENKISRYDRVMLLVLGMVVIYSYVHDIYHIAQKSILFTFFVFIATIVILHLVLIMVEILYTFIFKYLGGNILYNINKNYKTVFPYIFPISIFILLFILNDNNLLSYYPGSSLYGNYNEVKVGVSEYNSYIYNIFSVIFSVARYTVELYLIIIFSLSFILFFVIVMTYIILYFVSMLIKTLNIISNGRAIGSIGFIISFLNIIYNTYIIFT